MFVLDSAKRFQKCLFKEIKSVNRIEFQNQMNFNEIKPANELNMKVSNEAVDLSFRKVMFHITM